MSGEGNQRSWRITCDVGGWVYFKIDAIDFHPMCVCVYDVVPSHVQYTHIKHKFCFNLDTLLSLYRLE